jgi:putative FmdB family regulatory protein
LKEVFKRTRTRVRDERIPRMPIYEYACTACGERTEAKQGFDDPPLETCEICGGKLRKLYSPVGVVFKGSGFYSTDARTKKGSGAKPEKKDGGKASKSDGASGDKPTSQTTKKEGSTS